MAATAKRKMRDDCARLRAQGLRPIQVWVPDTRSRALWAEAKRQSQLAAQKRGEEAETSDLIEALQDWD